MAEGTAQGPAPLVSRSKEVGSYWSTGRASEGSIRGEGLDTVALPSQIGPAPEAGQ